MGTDSDNLAADGGWIVLLVLSVVLALAVWGGVALYKDFVNAGPAEFQSGECLEWVDSKGLVNETAGVVRSPMRILGRPAPGKYFVEWTSTYGVSVDRFKATVFNGTDGYRLMKVICQ